MDLKELHRQAAEAGEGTISLTIGDLTALAEAVKDRIPKAPTTQEEFDTEPAGDAKTRDVYLSCVMAGEVHSENIRCLKFAPDVLCLTSLIEGPAVTSKPFTRRQRPQPIVDVPTLSTETTTEPTT